MQLDNVALFYDTQNRIKHDAVLSSLTKRAIENTSIIEEGFVSKKTPSFPKSDVHPEENLTLIPAYRLADVGKKTALLNFANPVEPGGGVLRGASAQEEYLCRASNLYPCLTSFRASDYYQANNLLLKSRRSSMAFFGTDRLVYTSGVTFFREDVGYYPDCVECHPTQEYTDRWRTIDVITCAAPYFIDKGKTLPQEDLHRLFASRIRNILESAIENEVESLVLGAFGCGAFNNPPLVVAEAFQSVLLEARYLHAFADVVFAIRRSSRFCENIEAFQMAFMQFPPTGELVISVESNKRRFFE